LRRYAFLKEKSIQKISFFLLILISIGKTPVKSKINILKKIVLIALLGSAFIITFLNLWTLM
jgi:hypothetical protein